MVTLDRFSGDNSAAWVLQAEQYFAFYNIFPKYQVSIASFYLDGEALDWYRLLFRNQQLAGWDNFVDKLLIRFPNRIREAPDLQEVGSEILRQLAELQDALSAYATKSAANSASEQLNLALPIETKVIAASTHESKFANPIGTEFDESPQQGDTDLVAINSSEPTEVQVFDENSQGDSSNKTSPIAPIADEFSPITIMFPISKLVIADGIVLPPVISLDFEKNCVNSIANKLLAKMLQRGWESQVFSDMSIGENFEDICPHQNILWLQYACGLHSWVDTGQTEIAQLPSDIISVLDKSSSIAMVSNKSDCIIASSQRDDSTGINFPFDPSATMFIVTPRGTTSVAYLKYIMTFCIYYGPILAELGLCNWYDTGQCIVMNNTLVSSKCKHQIKYSLLFSLALVCIVITSHYSTISSTLFQIQPEKIVLTVYQTVPKEFMTSALFVQQLLDSIRRTKALICLIGNASTGESMGLLESYLSLEVTLRTIQNVAQGVILLLLRQQGERVHILPAFVEDVVANRLLKALPVLENVGILLSVRFGPKRRRPLADHIFVAQFLLHREASHKPVLMRKILLIFVYCGTPLVLGVWDPGITSKTTTLQGHKKCAASKSINDVWDPGRQWFMVQCGILYFPFARLGDLKWQVPIANKYSLLATFLPKYKAAMCIQLYDCISLSKNMTRKIHPELATSNSIIKVWDPGPLLATREIVHAFALVSAFQTVGIFRNYYPHKGVAAGQVMTLFNLLKRSTDNGKYQRAKYIVGKSEQDTQSIVTTQGEARCSANRMCLFSYGLLLNLQDLNRMQVIHETRQNDEWISYQSALPSVGLNAPLHTVYGCDSGLGKGMAVWCSQKLIENPHNAWSVVGFGGIKILMAEGVILVYFKHVEPSDEVYGTYVFCGIDSFSMMLYPNLEDKVLIEGGSIVMNDPDGSDQVEVFGPRSGVYLGQGIKPSNKRMDLVWDPG